MRNWRAGVPLLGAVPAFVAIWGGWVSLGEMCGFGTVTPLPGITDWTINLAITLPFGMEIYSAYAVGMWLSGHTPPAARRFAAWSACASFILGAGGQVAYHVMAAWGWHRAPAPVVTVVACLPVVVFGLSATLAHLIREGRGATPGSVEGAAPEPASRPIEVDPWWFGLEEVLTGIEDVFDQQNQRLAAEKAAAEQAQADAARIAQARTERDAERAARGGMFTRLADALGMAGQKPTEAELRDWLELRLAQTQSVPSRDQVRANWRPAPANPVIDRLRAEVAQAAQERAADRLPETTSEGV